MKKLRRFYVEHYSIALQSRTNYKYNENKLYFILHFLLSAFLISLLFFIFGYTNNGIWFNIRFYMITVICSVTISYVNVKTILEVILFQRKNNYEYSVSILIFDKVIGLLATMFTICYILLRVVYFDISTSADLLLFSIFAVLFQAIFILLLSLRRGGILDLLVTSDEGGKHPVLEIMRNIFLVVLLVMIYFSAEFSTSITLNTIIITIILLVVYVIRYFLNEYFFFKVKFLGFLYVLLFTIVLVYFLGGKLYEIDYISTNPVVYDVIELPKAFNTFFVNDGLIYIENDRHVDIYDTSGTFVSTILMEEPVRIDKYNDEVKLFMYQDYVLKMFHITEDFDVIEEPLNQFECLDNQELEKVAKHIYNHNFVLEYETCYDLEGSKLIHQDEDNYIIKDPTWSTSFYQSFRRYNQTYKGENRYVAYSNNKFFVYYINTYESEYPFEEGYLYDVENVELDNYKLLFNNDSMSIDFYNSYYLITNYREIEPIYFEYSNEMIFLHHKSYKGEYMAVYDKEMNLISYLDHGFETYNIDNGKMYVKSGKSFVVYKLDELSTFNSYKQINYTDYRELNNLSVKYGTYNRVEHIWDIFSYVALVAIILLIPIPKIKTSLHVKM